MSNKNHNKLPNNLPQLQNLIKRDPESYKDEEKIGRRGREEGPVAASRLMFMDVFPRSSGWYDPLMTALFEEGLSELVKDIDIQFYEKLKAQQERDNDEFPDTSIIQNAPIINTTVSGPIPQLLPPNMNIGDMQNSSHLRLNGGIVPDNISNQPDNNGNIPGNVGNMLSSNGALYNGYMPRHSENTPGNIENIPVIQGDSISVHTPCDIGNAHDVADNRLYSIGNNPGNDRPIPGNSGDSSVHMENMLGEQLELHSDDVGNHVIDDSEAITRNPSNTTINITCENVQIGTSNTLQVGSNGIAEAADESILYGIDEIEDDIVEDVPGDDAPQSMTGRLGRHDDSLHRCHIEDVPFPIQEVTPMIPDPDNSPNAHHSALQGIGDLTACSTGTSEEGTMVAEGSLPEANTLLSSNSCLTSPNAYVCSPSNAHEELHSTSTSNVLTTASVQQTCQINLIGESNNGLDISQRSEDETYPKLIMSTEAAGQDSAMIYSHQNDLNLEGPDQLPEANQLNVLISTSDNNDDESLQNSMAPKTIICKSPEPNVNIVGEPERHLAVSGMSGDPNSFEASDSTTSRPYVQFGTPPLDLTNSPHCNSAEQMRYVTGATESAEGAIRVLESARPGLNHHLRRTGPNPDTTGSKEPGLVPCETVCESECPDFSALLSNSSLQEDGTPTDNEVGDNRCNGMALDANVESSLQAFSETNRDKSINVMNGGININPQRNADIVVHEPVFPDIRTTIGIVAGLATITALVIIKYKG